MTGRFVFICRERGIVYQMYGLFGEENRELLDTEVVRERSMGQEFTAHQAAIRLLMVVSKAQGLKLCIVDGTTCEVHMKENLSVVSRIFEWEDAVVQKFAELPTWA